MVEFPEELFLLPLVPHLPMFITSNFNQFVPGALSSSTLRLNSSIIIVKWSAQPTHDILAKQKTIKSSRLGLILFRKKIYFTLTRL